MKSFGFVRKNPATGQPLRNAKGAPVIGTATTSSNPKLADWQHSVASAAQSQFGEDFIVFTGAVALSVVFYLPRPVSLPRRVIDHVKKPDLDKLVRAIKDALKGVAWNDDSQVMDLCARKRYATLGTPCSAFVTIEEPGRVPASDMNQAALIL